MRLGGVCSLVRVAIKIIAVAAAERVAASVLKQRRRRRDKNRRRRRRRDKNRHRRRRRSRRRDTRRHRQGAVLFRYAPPLQEWDKDNAIEQVGQWGEPIITVALLSTTILSSSKQ